MWGRGEEDEFQLRALIWAIQPSVQRGLAGRPRYPVVPVYNPDAQPIPQCLTVSTMLTEKTPEDLLFVALFVAQVKGEGKTRYRAAAKVQAVLNNQPSPSYPGIIKTVSVTCDVPKKPGQIKYLHFCSYSQNTENRIVLQQWLQLIW